MSFDLDNLPYGSVEHRDGRRSAAVRFGDSVYDLAGLDGGLFGTGNLDALLAAGREVWNQVRAAARAAIEADTQPLLPLDAVRPVLAFTVADYVDFYASEDHATNAGRIFRPNDAPLTSNWKHLPIGYHGRSGSVTVSGATVRRPRGLVGPGEFVPSRRLDFEAEVGFVVGTPGTEIAVDRADEHVFGVCLVNDWSARDVQAFETRPLGPFLGKSFATSVAAWITPLSALDAARRPHPAQQPTPVPSLIDDADHGLDLDLEIAINGQVVSRPRFADMYWTYAQMLTHLTSNGAAVRPGDLFASGTVSGPSPEQYGSLLELSWNGTQPVPLPRGGERTYLSDGDVVTITASAGLITLGEVSGQITPA